MCVSPVDINVLCIIGFNIFVQYWTHRQQDTGRIPCGLVIHFYCIQKWPPILASPSSEILYVRRPLSQCPTAIISVSFQLWLGFRAGVLAVAMHSLHVRLTETRKDMFRTSPAADNSCLFEHYAMAVEVKHVVKLSF